MEVAWANLSIVRPFFPVPSPGPILARASCLQT